MSVFPLNLQSATQYEQIEDVESFVGVDDSGSFGILFRTLPHDDPAHIRAGTLPG